MEWFGFWLMLGMIFAASEIKDGMEEAALRRESAAEKMLEAVQYCVGAIVDREDNDDG